MAQIRRKYYWGGGRNTYILIYSIAYDKDLDDYAESLSKKTGLKILRLCSNWTQLSKNIFRHEKKILLPGILQFISLFDNARYVITNSFHGTAFSLNLNKDFICFYNGPKATRLENILDMTHTLHRHAESYDDFDIINRPVNWNEVNSILDGERRKASDWLRMVFADIQKHTH